MVSITQSHCVCAIWRLSTR